MQGFPARDDDQRPVQLACQVPQPGVGELHPPGVGGRRHEGFIGVRDDDRLLAGAGSPEILSEQVGHRVAEFPVRQPVQGLQGGVTAYPQAAAYVSRSSLEEFDQPHRGAEDRHGRSVVEDVAQDRAVLDERQFLFAQPHVGVQPLPQHGVGDVEAVEVHALRPELAAEHC